MDQRKQMVKKVDVYALLAILSELYDKGVNYVDIYGKSGEGEEEDTIGFYFSKEYMDKEHTDSFEDMELPDTEKTNIDIKLTDEDLNDLI